MSEIRKIAYLHKGLVILMLAVAAGGSLVGIVLDYFSGMYAVEMPIMSVMFPLGILVTILLFLGMMLYSDSFDISLRCNYTRRKFVVFTNLTYFLTMLVTAYLVLGIHHLEVLGFNRFAGASIPAAFPVLSGMVLAICFALTSLICLFGALYSRVGKVAFWIIWALWMIIFVGFSALVSRLEGTPYLDRFFDVLLFFFGSQVRIALTFTGIGLIFQIVGAVLVLRQAVRS
ncbi:MAG: hypothetical protein K6A92_10260 [Lachnospiraceae bacterium]|nr:hypothetical protein [Lachnospiraceae bacterium]